MKFSVLLSLVMLTSCATHAPKTYEQRCAERGMVLRGVNASSGTTSNYNYNYGVTTGSYSGENVSCEVPANDIQRCQVGVLRHSTDPIENYNSGVQFKNLLAGVGYITYVIPGFVAKYYYDKQRSTALSESLAIQETMYDKCKPEAPREPAAQN